MAVPTYTKSGSKATTAAELDMTVFGVEPKNHELLKQAYQTYLANGRENLAKTLRRGEVRGGGRKPWKQKGTGRARFGSIRVPIWRGGGITFGPLGEENYSKKITTASKRTAIRQSLTLKANDSKIVIVEDFIVKDGKTKTAAELLKKLGANRRTLIAVENRTPELSRAVANLPNVELVQASYLNTYSIMNADLVIITTKALEAVHTWLSKAPAQKKTTSTKTVTKEAK
jgi:large subunit ribosomal protein L4